MCYYKAARGRSPADADRLPAPEGSPPYPGTVPRNIRLGKAATAAGRAERPPGRADADSRPREARRRAFSGAPDEDGHSQGRVGSARPLQSRSLSEKGGASLHTVGTVVSARRVQRGSRRGKRRAGVGEMAGHPQAADPAHAGNGFLSPPKKQERGDSVERNSRAPRSPDSG